MTGETDTEIPDTGAVFTFGKSKIANNVPSRLWLKNDIPVHISCGQSHSAFVTEQGRLFVFGSNNSGQLGLQTKGPVTKPICVKVLKGERVQFVACGTDHTLVSTSQGEFFASGGNNDGQLGLGHCNDSTSFQRLHPFCDYAPVKLLSAGGHTSAALTEDGRLFLWGDNSVGQLGLGNDSHALLPEELKLGQSIQWVSCGYRHSALVTDNGDVFTFGESADGRLGLSADQLANHTCPQRVESLHGVLQVACGGKHTLALTEDELYSFGRGEFGQLGLGTQMFVTHAPVAVGHFRKGRVTHVACGENHSALITDSGLLYTFGDGRHGKLGFGDENFTNQFSPAVCQRFFDYSVMTVACGSSHMLVFARPRQRDSEEVCLEDEDVTYSYLDRCYTSMLQGQPLEHIAEPAPALVSQLTFIPSSLPTSHRWSLSTRARRRQRESSSAQFGPEFCNLPPLTTGFTALALTGKMLQPRSPTDTPKRFKTVESPSTSITLPDWTPPLTPITKSAENCHSVSMSDKTHEQHTNKMARASSIGKKENVPQQTPPTDVQAGSVSHPSMTESLPPSNLKHKKPRSGDPKNPAMQEECFSAASQSKMQSKTYKTPIQSTNNKLKVQAVEVGSSPKRMSAKEREGCWETLSTNTDSRHKVAKADKNGKVQHTDPRGQEDSTQAEIQNISSPVQEVKQVRTTPTKVQEVKSHEIKDEGISERATKWAKSPVKVQDVPSGRMEVSVVKSTLQTDPAQKDIKPSIGKAKEVRSTLIDTQQQGNTTSVKIPAKMHSTPKKGNVKNHVDAEENPTPKKAKKKRSDVERALMAETAPKTPSPQSDSIPTRMAKVKKEKPVDAENSNVQLRTEILEHVKRDNDSKTPQNSNISFPPIENRKSGGAAEISQSTSNLQSEHKHSQSPTDKVLTEQKYDFPSIKSLTPERSHSFSKLWSNNESATSKSSATKETESSSGYLLSPSPQHRQSPINEIKLKSKSVEPEEPNRTPQPEQSIMGSVVSLLPAMAIASAAPLLIKAAEVLSETSPEQSDDMSLCASVSQEIAGNNILPEQEVDQDSTVQDVSAIEEIDDSSTKKQSAQDVQNKVVLDENGKMEDVEDIVRDSETEREEERGEEESLAEEEDESEGVGQKEAVEDEERESNNNEDGGSVQKGEEDGEEEEGEEEESEGVGQKEAVEDEERESNNNEDGESVQKGEEDGEEEEGEEEESEGVGQKEAVEDEERESNNNEDGDSVQKGEEDGEEEEGEEEESEAAGEEDDDSNSRQSSKSEGEKSEGEEGRDETDREEEESEGQEKEEDEDGEMEENKDEESGGEDEEKESESWDEGSKGEVEDDEKTEAEEEQEGESSNEEKMEVGEQSDSEDENKNVTSDEEEGESEERDVSEEEENETGEEEGEQEEKGDEESQEEDEVGNEDEEENQDEETDHEEEEGNRDQEEEEEEEGEEDKEEEVDKEDNNEELKYKKDGVTSGEEEEGEESVREEEQQNEVEAEDEENISDKDADEDKERQEGSEQIEEEDEDKEEGEKEREMDTSEVKFRGKENLSETLEENRGDEDDEVNKPIEMMEENEEDSGSEKEEEEEETDKKEENKKTDISGRKQTETNEEEEEDGEEEEEETEQKENSIKSEINRKQKESSEEEEYKESEEEEEEEEAEQKEMNIKMEKNRMKQRETSEEEEQEEESEEEEEEEAEQKEMNIKTEKNQMKQRETSEEEEQEEESEKEEEEEEEAEWEDMNIKTDKSRRKTREAIEEEEQEEESEEEEVEEEAEWEDMNIKTEKNRIKQKETSEEEEQEEEGDDEEEEETEKKDKIGRKQTETTEEEEEEEEEEQEEGEEEESEEEEEEEGEEEEEEEKTKKVEKQRAKPNLLPARRQTIAQRDRQKTRERDQQNVKGKKQTDSGAQDPQFWNSVLPQYLNLK